MGWLVHGAAPKSGPYRFEPLGQDDPAEIGGYRLRARLGSGGMGQVYLAFTPDGQPVAVKVIHREIADDPRFRTRFAHEVRAAQRVNSEYVAQLLDADPEAARPWLATAYVAGPTLRDAVRSTGPLSATAVTTLITTIAESLQAIHSAGIVHRDLKPANVVLGPEGLRVIDFGVAHVADSTSLTLSGMLLGSAQYTAPEQVLGLPATAATDVFALGSLACFAATGRPAFGDGPDISVVFRVVNTEPDLSDCPAELRPLITSCLAKTPADRPTTSQLIEMCRPTQAQSAAEWLPAAVTDAIEERTRALTALVKGSADDRDTPSPPTHPGRGRHAADHDTTWRMRPKAGSALAVGLLAFGTAVGIVIARHSVKQAPRRDSPTLSAPGGTIRTSPPAGGGPQGTDPSPPGPGDSFGPPPIPIDWTGTIQLTPIGIGLDQLPPVAASRPGAPYDIRLAPSPPTAISTNDGVAPTSLAKWTETTPPTNRQCASLITAHGVRTVPIAVGDTVCVQTDQGRIATLTIKTIATNSPSVTATATIWAPFPPPQNPLGPPP